jgi:hypothetical protein
MNEPMTTLIGGPCDQSAVPTANFMDGRSSVMAATDTQSTCPAAPSDVPPRASGLGTRSAVYELADGGTATAKFLGWTDELAMARVEKEHREEPA